MIVNNDEIWPYLMKALTNLAYIIKFDKNTQTNEIT